MFVHRRRIASPTRFRPTSEPEVAGLLALVLLHHARRGSRTSPGRRLLPLREQDRSRWDTGLITEGLTILQAALSRDRLGEHQAQAAVAAPHADVVEMTGGVTRPSGPAIEHHS